MVSADIDDMPRSRRKNGDLDTFGKRLKLARELKGLKSNALSRLIDAEESYISQIESAKKSHSSMRPERLIALARALDVRLEWLVNGDGPMRQVAATITEPPVYIHPTLEKMLREPSMRRRWLAQTIAAVRADPCDDRSIGEWIDKLDDLDKTVRRLWPDQK